MYVCMLCIFFKLSRLTAMSHVKAGRIDQSNQSIRMSLHSETTEVLQWELTSIVVQLIVLLYVLYV